jgi:C4-dicarboxylate transporter, DctM subunit
VENLYVGFLGILLFVVLILLSVPITYAMAAVGIGGLVSVYGIAGVVQFIPAKLYSFCSTFTFAALPLFLLMGFVAFYADLSKDSYDAARAWLGKIPGGLAVATVYACALFGAVSGSGLAEAAVFSKIAVPEMLRSGYNKRLSLGVVATASGIDALIPPSILMVVLGVMTETSIGKLLIAGILPGVLFAAVLAVAISLFCYLKPSYAPRLGSLDTSWKTRIRTLRNIWAVCILFILVLGSIYMGWATPDEAAGVGVIGAILVLIQRKKFSWSNLAYAAVDCGKASAMLFLLCGTATIFTQFLSVTKVISTLTGWMTGIGLPFWLLMVVLIVLYLFLGCLMDSVSMLVLTLPFVVPIMQAHGADIVWFGVVFVMLACIGGITPPFGLTIFVMKGTLGKEVEINDIFAGALPFVILQLFLVSILCLFPQISLWLPGVMFGK